MNISFTQCLYPGPRCLILEKYAYIEANFCADHKVCFYTSKHIYIYASDAQALLTFPHTLSPFSSIPLLPPAAMILAYRYIRDKRRKAKASREAQEQGLTSPPSRTASDDAQTVQGQVPSPGAPTTPSSVLSSTLKWRILLMVALLVPVLFETLDYTGGYCPWPLQ